jgi:hypothetical protein
MKVAPAEIENLLKLLAQTPRRIAAASRGLEGGRLYFRPDEDSWSANDVLAHLRSCADVWGTSIMAMIAQEHPTLRYVSPRTWIRKTDYPELDFHLSLDAFARQRKELLKSLKSLGLKGWARGATFTATTRGREETVLSYVLRMSLHESKHCGQIEALLEVDARESRPGPR